MTKERLRLLGISLCLGLTSISWLTSTELVAQTSNQGIRPAQTQPANAGHRPIGGSSLLADRVEVSKKLQEQKKLRDTQLEEQLRKEALTLPAEELYGEDSWTEHVNPFAGRVVELPESYTFDLGEFVMPIDRKHVTSSYGYRRRFRRMHYGTDLALSIGDTVRASFSGKVRISSYNRGGYGHYVVLRHPNGLETVYGHLSRSLVKEGDIVRAGEVIALGGNSGRSTGPHLHFEARFMGIPINPELMFDFAEGTPRTDTYTFERRLHGGGMNYAATAKGASSKSGRASAAIKTYRIKKGDTLSKVAKAHGVTVAQLKSANQLKGDRLSVGKTLRIPS